jgi:hypothetical protein
MPIFRRAAKTRRHEFGAISVDVPSDWALSESDDPIEFRPPGDDGALHLSIYRRVEPSAPPPLEEREKLESFVRQSGGDPSCIETKEPGVATASFEVTSEEHEFHCDAIVKVWPERFVLGSYFCGRGGSSSRTEAVAALQSLRHAGE